IQDRDNALLVAGLRGVERMDFAQALKSSHVRRFDFIDHYVSGLGQVIDLEAIRHSGLKFAVDPLGGAGVHYWSRFAERYALPLEVLSTRIDPTFRFMRLDWDGKIRMDGRSPHAMAGLVDSRDRFVV